MTVGATPEKLEAKRKYMREYMRNYTLSPAAKANKRVRGRVSDTKARDTATAERRDKNRKYMREYMRKRNHKYQSEPRGHDLYIMGIDRFPGEFKVGRTADPKARALNMAGGYPWQVNLLKVFAGFGKYEKAVHKALAPFMIADESKPKTEWFRLPYDDLVKKINNIISQTEH